MVHWNHERLNRTQVDLLRRHGYAVCVYTVNDAAGFDRMLDLGVDAITTDQPRLLAEHLRSR